MKKYDTPIVEILDLYVMDVITASGDLSHDELGPNDTPIH